MRPLLYAADDREQAAGSSGVGGGWLSGRPSLPPPCPGLGPAGSVVRRGRKWP